MAILIDENTRLVVQGITGTSGLLQTKVMIDYGTKVVAGVTPGKGGRTVEGVPVYDFVGDAVREHGANALISFVPPSFAWDAAREAADAGVKLLVLTMEGIPLHDATKILAYAKERGTRVVGPGTAGIISPGKSKVGAHPARMFAPGDVGVVSKSGALSYETGKTLTDAGIGQTTVVALGGGPVWGTTQRDVIAMFNDDPETRVILLLGEIGGSMEDDAAEYIRRHVRKPVVALIVGRSAPKGRSLGHAGAIVTGSKGTAEAKMRHLAEVGVTVVRTPAEVVETIGKMR